MQAAPSLTLLAPALFDTILNAHHASPMTLAVRMRPFAVGWAEQRLGAHRASFQAHA
jgi:hypothetical protein